MKKFTVVVTFIVSVLIFGDVVFANDVAFRLSVSRNDQFVGGELHADLQMRITAGTSPRTLHSLTVDVNYSSELTEWATDPSTGWAIGPADGYVPSTDKFSGRYRLLVIPPLVNFAGNLTPPGSPAGWDVTTGWQTLVTLRWTINTATSVNMSINDASDAAAFFDNYTNAPRGGASSWIVTNDDIGDISLPVSLSGFSAKALQNKIVLSWATQSEINNAGFEIYRSTEEEGEYGMLSGYQNNPELEGQGNTNTEHDYGYTDNFVVAGQTYWYKLADIDFTGARTFHQPVSALLTVDGDGISSTSPDIPKAFKFYPNFPNPFNPETVLRFDIPQLSDGNSQTQIFIHNSLGQLVRKLYNGSLTAGTFEIKWDGKTGFGNVLPSGFYFATLNVGNYYSDTIKMLLVR